MKIHGWRISVTTAPIGCDWEVYHSGYGLMWGWAWTRGKAEKAAREAILDLLDIKKAIEE
jgi:hypothetical protein